MTKLTVRLLAAAAIALVPTFALAQAAGGSAGGTGSSAGVAGAGATSGATTGSSAGAGVTGSPSQLASPNAGGPTLAPGTTPIAPGTTQIAPGTTGSISGSSPGLTSDQAPGLQRGVGNSVGTTTLPSSNLGAPTVANPPAQHPECASIADPLQHSRCLDQ